MTTLVARHCGRASPRRVAEKATSDPVANSVMGSQDRVQKEEEALRRERATRDRGSELRVVRVRKREPVIEEGEDLPEHDGSEPEGRTEHFTAGRPLRSESLNQWHEDDEREIEPRAGK